jgi:aldehyde dehydrogenase (NAD+)
METPARTIFFTAVFLYVIHKWLKKPRDRKVRYSPGPPLIPNQYNAEEIAKIAFDKHSKAFQNHVTAKKYDEGRWDLDWRLQQLFGLRALITENYDAILQASFKDIGRTPSEWLIESQAILADLNLLIDNLQNWMEPEKRSWPLWMLPSSSRIQLEPLGVCLVFSAWNYQMTISLLPVAGALAAGNAVVLKPSELAPAQAELLRVLLPKYVDPEAVSVICGGPDVAQHLLEKYSWDMVFYTGGGKVGSIIGESCGRRLIKCCLELGGKSPTIIDSTASLTVTCRRIVQGKFVNSGQTCIAPDYLVIVGDEKRKEQVIQALLAEIKYCFGDNTDELRKSNEYARIVTAGHFKRIKGLLDTCGGKIVYGGKHDESSRFFPPCVIEQFDENSAAAKEEIFGPLLLVKHVPTIEAAVDYVRARPKPLTLYVFSESRKNIDYVMARTTSGSAAINEAVFQYLVSDLPFGGVGSSGSGAYHGYASVKEFSHARSILERYTYFDVFLRYHPWLGQPWVQKLFAFLMPL